QPVRAFDPLFLSKRSRVCGAQMFGNVLEFDVCVSNGQQNGRVTVMFSLLPVAQWHALSNDEKRSMGISKGAGMSVVRAGREVDYGWWFFGDKRKENYDD